MSDWIFGLLVLGFGVALAILVDRMKRRPGSGPQEPEQRSERAKWLYFWYLGRFPSQDEQRKDDEQDRLEQKRAGDMSRPDVKPEDGAQGGKGDGK